MKHPNPNSSIVGGVCAKRASFTWAARLLCLGVLLSSASAVESDPAKVWIINSYHEGYPPSDEVTQALTERLRVAGVDFRVFYLDSKRRADAVSIAERVAELMGEIQEFDPDLVVAMDDNAVRYGVVPYLKDGSLPVLFCGVNWSCSDYGLPASNVTGMLEVLPLRAAINFIRAERPATRTLLILSENTHSERKNRQILDPIFHEAGLVPSYALVDTFEQWKTTFRAAQAQVDLVYLPTNGAIAGWHDDTASAWVREHIQVPVFTCDDFMMPFAAFGLTKIAAEQGIWVAEAALQILDGVALAEIPVVENQQSTWWINAQLAKRINLQFPETVQAAAHRVEQP